MPPVQVQPRRSSRYVAGVLLALIIATCIVVLMVLLVVHPTRARYSIEYGSITGFNLSNERLNANFHFGLRAVNPNRRMSLYYDKIDVAVLHGDQKLSINNVHPFYQPPRNVKLVELDLMAKNATVNRAMARDLKKERAKGYVILDVKIRARTRLKIGVIKIHRTLKLYCKRLNVPYDSRKGFHRISCYADVDD